MISALSSTEADLQCSSITQPLPSAFAKHRAVFVIGAFALLGSALGGLVANPLDMPVLTGLAILVLGVPHGAFDVALWTKKTGARGHRAVAVMLLRYLALATSVFGLWLLAPALALPAFIAMSIYHFSGDWQRDFDVLPRLVVAAAILVAPAAFNRVEVAEIFSWLSPRETAELVALVMAAAALPLLQASAIVITVVVFRKPWAAAELVALLALAWLTPPLLFFLVYFCGLHSIRHVIETRHVLDEPSARQLALTAFPYASLAIAGTLAGAVMLSTLPLGPALVGTVFMALGALTVPHVVVVDLRSS